MCLWFVHDLPMICLWFVYGLSMVVCQWFVRGLSMVCPWFVHGLSMVWPWFSHGILCSLCESPMMSFFLHPSVHVLVLAAEVACICNAHWPGTTTPISRGVVTIGLGRRMYQLWIATGLIMVFQDLPWPCKIWWSATTHLQWWVCSYPGRFHPSENPGCCPIRHASSSKAVSKTPGRECHNLLRTMTWWFYVMGICWNFLS